jgi:hypothetical protein
MRCIVASMLVRRNIRYLYGGVCEHGLIMEICAYHAYTYDAWNRLKTVAHAYRDAGGAAACIPARSLLPWVTMPPAGA